ncbi:DUF599 domain-containing protein [Palleronia sp. LCG004]|uniref:DUF599 domain-containing protein n=1 Tax=Palleronia sp. LCG004 TaxID=3079304 RepID=UPI0029427228|nr:DUF599 domain-containing protein [Palleronia sp. LCG004]WOI57104.1 DUF599 domain-containing protein [Palleronia sp. LCG004]
MDHLVSALLPPLLGPWDYGALALTFLGWWLVGLRIEHPGLRRPSVTVLMMKYRRDWMERMVERDPRIFDAQALSSLRQSTSFFASTSVIAIGGALAVSGNVERLQGVAEGLGETGIPVIVWQVKLLPIIIFLMIAFLKFVWSNRLFGYSMVVMAAVPNDPRDPLALPRAAQSAELNIRAAVNFNRGLRAIYFALAALAWLAGPLALGAAATIAIWIVWSREFMSRPRDILMGRL